MKSSLLSWERGLKCKKPQSVEWTETVAPLVGAWIEMSYIVAHLASPFVAPLVGAWIEIWCIVYNTARNSVAPLVGAWIEIE